MQTFEKEFFNWSVVALTSRVFEISSYESTPIILIISLLEACIDPGAVFEMFTLPNTSVTILADHYDTIMATLSNLEQNTNTSFTTLATFGRRTPF